MKISYTKYLIILLITFIISMSSSLAYYSWGSTENTNIAFDVIADSVYIYYEGGENIIGANLYPTDDKNDGIVKNITVKVDREIEGASFNLYLDLKTIPEELLDQSFRYALYDGTTVIKQGSITDTTSTCTTNSTNHIVLLNNIMPTTTEITYTLYLWIDGVNYTNPDDMMNQEFEFLLHADGINLRDKSLYNIMASNSVLDNISSTYVTSSTGIDFSQISSDTNGKGIYELSTTANGSYPIYYYRGDVNNNLIFADFCWKIVRTTETGGIKLIYNGSPTDGTCNNQGNSTQISTSPINSNKLSIAYFGYMYGDVYEMGNKDMSSITDTYYYGNTVTYSNGTYTLSDTISISDWSSVYINFGDYHYTCFSSDITCSSVYYLYNAEESLNINYVVLSDGTKIEEAITKMLDNNSNDSTIKTVVDNWYNNNIEQKGYSNYIEDTIWCNNRSIYEYGGWDSNTKIFGKFLRFKSLSKMRYTYTPDFICDLEDSFTKDSNNGNGKLDYSVGLITLDEIMLAGGFYQSENSTYYLFTGNNFWSLSPYSIYHNSSVYNIVVYRDGRLGVNNYYDNYGVRPCISLKKGTKISSGDGTTNNPYTIITE